MLGHPMGDKVVVIATMTANKNLVNHGVLAGKHPGVPHGPYTIVERGGSACKFPLAS